MKRRLFLSALVGYVTTATAPLRYSPMAQLSMQEILAAREAEAIRRFTSAFAENFFAESPFFLNLRKIGEMDGGSIMASPFTYGNFKRW